MHTLAALYLKSTVSAHENDNVQTSKANARAFINTFKIGNMFLMGMWLAELIPDERTIHS